MSSTIEAEPTGIRRDEKGRPIAADGYPISGLAHAKTIAAIPDLSVSTIYAMIASGELESRPFGRSRRVPWAAVRKMFLETQDGDA